MPRDNTKVFKDEVTFVSLEALQEELLKNEESDDQGPTYMQEIGTNKWFDAAPFLDPDFLENEKQVTAKQQRSRLYQLLRR